MDDIEDGFVVGDGGGCAHVEEVFGELAKLLLYFLELSVLLGVYYLQQVLLICLHQLHYNN